MDKGLYTLTDTKNIISPALIYYKDIILDNTKRLIEMAGGPGQLWPHVKTHKTAELIRMQLEFGITRFKCATIPEAEMTASNGAEHIIFAFPLVGPNISRYFQLKKAYPQTVFYAIGDDFQQLYLLAEEASRMGTETNVFIDVDLGMHRTGVPIDQLEALYLRASALTGLSLKGLHCYDGHRLEQDFNSRKLMVDESDQKVLELQKSLKQKGLDAELLVMGGTPGFPCRCGKAGFFLSPGTLFVGDWNSYSCLSDFTFIPGAAIFSRVVSHPGSRADGNTFTLDLGSKGISTDSAEVRGVITGLPEAKPVFQSEEHWIFSLPEDMEKPPIGSEHYVIPSHICPTMVLYPEVLVAQGGKLTERWQVYARDRRINF